VASATLKTSKTPKFCRYGPSLHLPKGWQVGALSEELKPLNFAITALLEAKFNRNIYK